MRKLSLFAITLSLAGCVGDPGPGPQPQSYKECVAGCPDTGNARDLCLTDCAAAQDSDALSGEPEP